VNETPPLHFASDRGTKEVAELLIARGADVNAKSEDGWTPLHSAAGGQKEIAEFLIENGADVNARRNANWQTPLHQAALWGSKEIAALLIAKGADVNAKGKYGRTPLHYAASRGLNKIIELLIARGAGVNTKIEVGDYKGQTPLDGAIQWNQTETADLLRKHGGKTGEELKAEGK